MIFFIILSIIMFFFCLYFYLNTQKLKQEVSKLELDIKEILERKLTPTKEDLISIEKLSIESINNPLKEDNELKTEDTLNKKIDYPFDKPIKQEKYKAKPNNNYEEIPNTISLKNKPKKKIDIQANLNVTMDLITPNDFNPNEFIRIQNNKKSEDLRPKQNEYLMELSKQLDEELTPKTIELTDYEQEQEEKAIISYQELLSLKSNQKIADIEENKFIDDLKEFRKTLE